MLAVHGVKQMEAHQVLNLSPGQVPDDHSQQVSAEYYIDYYYRHLKCSSDTTKVMDLGCGDGRSIDLFRHQEPDVQWIGIDIENSPEVRSRNRSDAEFRTFDGVHIPFGDNNFDLIYSKHVFEHVQYPDRLLQEVHRVLKPNGYFMGSTSHLEPYHSYSFWNYTPYGFKSLLAEANLELLEIRPGIDGVSLMIWSGLGGPKFFSSWWVKESPLNQIINLTGKLKQRSHALINAKKLLFCGQFSFLIAKR